jgi:hypothetical protein
VEHHNRGWSNGRREGHVSVEGTDKDDAVVIFELSTRMSNANKLFDGLDIDVVNGNEIILTVQRYQ